MVHVPYHTTRILRRNQIQADYLAAGSSSFWDKSDYVAPQTRIPGYRVLLEFICFWRVVAKYQVVHLHFGLTMSRTGWELPWLKRLGRQIVVHYRGCEIRDYYKNTELHPKMNICQNCDYDRQCISTENKKRMRLAKRYGGSFIVTTPDLKDFVPDAVHIPFFFPEHISHNICYQKGCQTKGVLKILHWTNHPGIEGSEAIRNAIKLLQNKGKKIEYVFKSGEAYENILEDIASSDLTIGKMKMGYYANAQIESLALGIPAITWVRPEYSNQELNESGLILSHINEISDTIEDLINNPDVLKQKKKVARESAIKLHDNCKIASQYAKVYGF